MNRKEYEMTAADLQSLLDAVKPAPAIMLQCGPAPSQQERANNAWKALGDKMGFDHMSVAPIAWKSDRFFTASPKKPTALAQPSTEAKP